MDPDEAHAAAAAEIEEHRGRQSLDETRWRLLQERVSALEEQVERLLLTQIRFNERAIENLDVLLKAVAACGNPNAIP